MTGYNRGSLCRLARRIEKYPECANKMGISIEFIKTDISKSKVSEEMNIIGRRWRKGKRIIKKIINKFINNS